MKQPNRRSFLAAAAGTALMTHSSFAAMSGNNRIKVGQIGTRHAHAAGKMETVRKYSDVFDVVGVVEPDAAQRQKVATAAAYDGLKWMTQEQLLNVPGLQLVLVETDIDNLLVTAEACIAAGKHIHLDKPAGTSLPHFRRICEAADRQQLAIQMGYMFRGNAAFRFMLNAAKEGWLGDIFSVHCEMSKKVGDAERRLLAQYPGGAMFELGCHLIDSVVRLLGPPESVSAFNSNSRPEHDLLMDNCLAVLQYSRAVATVRSSVCEVQGQRRRQFVVCGTKGTIAIQPLEPASLQLTLEQATGGFVRGIQQVELPQSAGRYDGDLLHLAKVISKQEDREYGTAHDLQVQETLLLASQMLEPVSGLPKD